jgi:hypothetical protein
MKNFKYVFLILGIVYLLEVIYAFYKPRTSYEILSFNVPLFAFIVYRLLFGFVFIMLFRKSSENKS